MSGSGQKVVIAPQGDNTCDPPGVAITTILFDPGQEISTWGVTFKAHGSKSRPVR